MVQIFEAENKKTLTEIQTIKDFENKVKIIRKNISNFIEDKKK